MVITSTSLLFQMFYFIFYVTFLEFTYIPIFYWFIEDVGFMFISFHYCLDFIAKFYLDINFFCAQEEFCHLESLSEVLMVCIIYEHIYCFYTSFSISFRLGNIVVLILIIFALQTSHALCLSYYYLHYLLSTPLKNHV